MKKIIKYLLFTPLAISLFVLSASFYLLNEENEEVIIRPNEIDSVLVNPGIGFMTFQRFNGDKLNEGQGWTEGFPIEYQNFDGDLTNEHHPQTSIAYWRVYWRYLEPEKGHYRWDLLDQALRTAHQRGQTIMLRLPPYGSGRGQKTDVPDWYRKMVGDENDWEHRRPRKKWRVNPENPLYVRYYGDFIRAVGARYDGHPDLESMDLGIVGAWGEGDGSELLTEETMKKLVLAYTESFRKTPLIALLMDEKTNKFIDSQTTAGWRVDCLGDLGFWGSRWCHMYDMYPEAIIEYGVQDDWKHAPVSLEICGTFRRWRDKEHYTKKDVKYIFDQALKWHISSFNAKSSPVPDEWEPLVNDWLKRMGYRYVLRKFAYNGTVGNNGKITFQTWWENKGVAPIYKDFALAIRLKNDKNSVVMITDADIRKWLPGDIVYNNAVFVPDGTPAGAYAIQVGIVDPVTHEPKVKLAIEGITSDGWYQLGQISIR